MQWRSIQSSLGVALALAAVAAPAQDDVLFSETFTGPNRSEPQGWELVNTPPGSYWYLRGGTLSSGNGDTVTSQDKRTYAIANPQGSDGWDNCEILVDSYMIQRNGALMLVGRWQDQANHIQAIYETKDGRVSVRLVRVLNGRDEILAERTSADDPLLPNLANGATAADSHSFRLGFEGDRIGFSIDRREVLSASDSALSRGRAGVGQIENFAFFDNFRVVGEARAVAQTPAPAVPAGTAPPEDIQRVYRLNVAQDLTREAARNYQEYLLDQGYTPVILRENANGRYDLLTGTFLSRDEAQRRGDALAEEGELIAFRVEEIRGEQQAEAELAAAAAAPQVYAVQVGTTPNRPDAEETRRHLAEDLDYFPVTIIDRGHEYAILVGNFNDEAEAGSLLAGLSDEGFPFASVVETEREGLIESTAAAGTGIGQQVLAQLSADERQRIEQLLEQQRLLAGGGNTAEQIRQMQDLLRQLRQEQSQLRDSVATIQSEAQRQESMRRQINDLVAEAYTAIDASNWTDAQRLVDQILAIDANDAEGRVLQRRVQAARSSGGTATVTAAQQIIERARLQADAGDISGALTTLRLGERDFPTADIRAEIERMQDLEQQARQAEQDRLNQDRQRLLDEQAARTTRMLILIGAVFGGVLLVVLFLIFRVMSREKALRQQLEGGAAPRHRAAATAPAAAASAGLDEMMPDPLSSAPPSDIDTVPDLQMQPEMTYEAVSGNGGIGLDPSLANQSVDALSRMVLETIGPVGPKPVATGHSSLPPPVERRAVETPPPSESRVSLDFGFDDEGPGGSAPAHEPEPAPAALDDFDVMSATPKTPAPAPTPAAVSLDDFDFSGPGGGGSTGDPFADFSAPEPVKAPSAVSVEETQPLSFDDAFPGASDTQPVTAPAADVFDDAVTTPLTPAVSPAPAELPPGVHFQQRFTAAEAGKQPANWQGSYDFAKLTVTTENPRPGSEASLRFEKKSGQGSAFFTCHFPDAKGRVGVEFDLCCLSKNQYLLGIYFEHNENFRQSVHTVMHKSGETITLRLQGKSSPYDFGKWVHVKFRIDLNTGTVDGQVDGVPVAVNVPLLSMTEQSLPPSINTISIRDTLASEGVFMLDNLTVYKA